MTTARRFTPAGFSATFTACLSGRMTNLSCLPGLLTGHGTAITGRVGLMQFPKASLDPRSGARGMDRCLIGCSFKARGSGLTRDAAWRRPRVDEMIAQTCEETRPARKAVRLRVAI
jgi:hypothetical protein